MKDDRALQEKVRNAWLLLLVPLEILIGVGVAAATTLLLSYLVVLLLGRDSGIGGALFGYLAFIFGIVSGIVFVVFTATRRDPKLRFKVDIAGMVFAIVAFVIPVTYKDYARRADKNALAERGAAEEKASQIKFNAWLENMKKTGQHGPPGAVPPMLAVEDDGVVVRVLNNSDQEIMLALARVREDSSFPGAWKGCGMRHADNDDPNAGRRGYYVFVSPKKTRVFLLNTPCELSFRGVAIEYRVGQRPPEIGWWSDSAFTKPEGREMDGIR
jgi:hypothetical protein